MVATSWELRSYSFQRVTFEKRGIHYNSHNYNIIYNHIVNFFNTSVLFVLQLYCTCVKWDKNVADDFDDYIKSCFLVFCCSSYETTDASMISTNKYEELKLNRG